MFINDVGFFADFYAGWNRRLDLSGNAVVTFATGIVSPVDLKVGDGSVYYLARGTGGTTGTVRRVNYGTSSSTTKRCTGRQRTAERSR